MSYAHEYEYDWTGVPRWKRFRAEWTVRAMRLPGLAWRLAVAPVVYLVVMPAVMLGVMAVTWAKEWWRHQPFTAFVLLVALASGCATPPSREPVRRAKDGPEACARCAHGGPCCGGRPCVCGYHGDGCPCGERQ